MMNKINKFLLFLSCILIAAQTSSISQDFEDIKAFMEEEIEFDKYVFPPGVFPEFRWANPDNVAREIGKVELEAEFYNEHFNRVERADSIGRYGAVITGKTLDGYNIKKYVTLFCSGVEFDDYSQNVPIRINQLKDYEIDNQNWDLYRKNEERFSFGSLKLFPQRDPDAAIFLAGLKNLNNEQNYFTPRIADRAWWIKLKRKIEGTSNLQVVPKTAEFSQENILENSRSSAKYDSLKIRELRNLCKEWSEKGKEPNVTIIIHKGNIIFHEAFGSDEEGHSLTTESKMWMASITKLLTGVLMMKFVDENLISLDSSISIYLPETGINRNISVRDLFTHTTGFEFAGEWASDWNYALENQIGHLLSVYQPEKRFSYNRIGYSLAGKILERFSGEPVPVLFQKYIFNPLGMNSAYADNTYGGLYCTALDMAKLGQLLLHRGSYKGYSLFSEKSFNAMLPQQLTTVDRKWGIGTIPMDKCGLSSSAFGHSAASGSIFRIDPENDLVIVSARNSPGDFYKDYECSLIQMCVSLVKEK